MNILLIIFNRPVNTRKVFARIREVRPEKLFIAADGPRTTRVGEDMLCEETRGIIRDVDWPCEVTTRFQDHNMGCKLHESYAMSWFFNQVAEGIVLEDDCLPNISFFSFCTKMLERYRDNPEILAINGTDFLLPEEISDPTSTYRFSRCVMGWGWASWNRAWRLYDVDMKNIDKLSNNLNTYGALFTKEKYLRYFIRHFKHIESHSVDTWDAQWQYSILLNQGIVISPNFNLVDNIGFGKDATHTTDNNPHRCPTHEIEGVIKHPSSVIVDREADAILIEKIFMTSLYNRIKYFLNNLNRLIQ
ncbi:MAG: nucleotide-diphospho-sugar transferase [Candidatus Taylorbacteria bacterium]